MTMTDDKCDQCGGGVMEISPATESKRWSEVYFKCGSSVTEWPGGERQWKHSSRCDLTAARTRIAELEQQLEMSRDPMVIDESRWLDERNAGAESLARTIIGDTGAGSIAPGPCADLLELVRGLRRQLADANDTIVLRDVLIDDLTNKLAEKTRECERWERLGRHVVEFRVDSRLVIAVLSSVGRVFTIHPPRDGKGSEYFSSPLDALAAIEQYEAQQAAEVRS